MTRLARTGLAAAIAVAALTLAAAASADGSGTILVKDDCDRTTFNAVLGPGACVGNGTTTFQSFIAELTQRHKARAWNFTPRETEVDAGTPLTVMNVGGETHTFTEVKKFGPGFIQPLNDLVFGPGAVPIPEFQGFPLNLPAATQASFIRAGGTMPLAPLAPGLHRFECGIHPWMKAVVEVEED